MTIKFKLLMGKATVVEGTAEDIIQAIKSLQAMQPKKSLFKSMVETSYNVGKSLLEDESNKTMGKKRKKNKKR